MIKTTAFHPIVILLVLAIAIAGRGVAQDKPKASESQVGGAIEAAKAAAQEVLTQERTDNVVASKNSHLVYHAASLLVAAGMDEEARPWLQAAVRLSPHQLDWQWALSQLYDRAGEKDKAKSLAQLVRDRAETESLLEQSAAYLGEKPNWEVPALKDATPGAEVIGIILIGKVDRWLVHAAAQVMEQRFGYSVRLVSTSLELGEPDRTNAAIVAKEAAGAINWDTLMVRATMKDLGIESREKATEKQVLQLLATLMMAAGRQDQAVRWLKAYAEQAGQPQWNARRLMERLASFRIESTEARVVAWIALTEADIFGDNTNYVFALQSPTPPLAVVSAARFRATFFGTTPDKVRLQARLGKQLASSFGLVLGIPRCSDPRCVRAYPASLDEFDAKGETYCAECREKIETRLGRKLPK
jgi:predicted Zn-dependent protease